jgi:hypothetical protein
MRTSRHGYEISLGIRFTASFFNLSRASARFEDCQEPDR